MRSLSPRGFSLGDRGNYDCVPQFSLGDRGNYDCVPRFSLGDRGNYDYVPQFPLGDRGNYGYPAADSCDTGWGTYWSRRALTRA